MKKFLSVIILFVFIAGLAIFAIPSKAEAVTYPVPQNPDAYSVGRTIYINWTYSCSYTSCEIEIYEYITGIWDNIKTVKYNAKPVILTNQSFGKHTYRLRAKIQPSWLPIYSYSDYTASFYTYVLNTPTGFTVSTNPDIFFLAGSSDLTLKWNPIDSNANRVHIWRKAEGSDIYSKIAEISASLTTWNDSTVLPNRTYTYTIDAIMDDGSGKHIDQSSYSSYISKLTLPAAPTNFTANTYDKTTILTWQHTKDCDGYKVYRWDSSGMIVTWTLIATLSKNTLTYNTVVSNYGTYSFKVAAYNASGNSPKSPSKTTYALMTPTGLAASPLSPTSIKLTWNAVDSNATQIVVSYSTTGVAYYAIGAISSSLTSSNITGLNPSTKYYFKIKAKRDLNESLNSDAASAETLSVGTAPAVPTGLAGIAVSCSKIDLTWNDNSDNEDGFKIERKEIAGTYSEIVTVGPNLTTYSDTSVSAEKTYYYRIRSYNSYGYSAYTDEINITTPACGPVPAAPSNLGISLTAVTEAKLTWTDNSNNENGFKIERKVDGGTYAEIDSLSANSVQYTNTGLLPETTYYYRIRAFNSYGYSGYSNEASITTPSATSLPEAPTNLAANAATCNEVSLTWTDNAINETGFIIERKEDGGIYSSLTSSVTENSTSFTDNTVEPEKKYYYRIAAYNINGESAYSNEANTTTPPCGTVPDAPQNLSLSIVSATEIKLSWSDSSDNEDGFKIERKELGGTYAMVESTAANTTSYNDKNLNPNTIYYYRVAAYNSYGTSPYSNEANIKTPQVGNPPSAPTNLFASATSQSEISLSWTDTSDNELGFTLQRKTGSGSYSTIATLTENKTSYKDTGLSPETTYYYRISAFNNFGPSDYSNEADATTLKEVIPQPEEIIIRLYIDKTTYYVNDELKTMDAAPIIKESRTLLPIRYVAEALGATVQWDATERKVTIVLNETTIELWIDNNSAKVNGEYKFIDPANPKVVPVIIPPGRTMLPIRFIAENLGCRVDWNADLREVKITYPG
jgi:phosphodiesterase/alkaline phosphatase D-like protein